MHAPTDNIEALFKRVEVYTTTSIQLAKLQALEATTNVVSILIARLSVAIVLTLFVLVFNIGLALWIGELLGKAYYGFFVVAAFYLVTGITLHLFLHRWIKKPVSDLIINQALQ